MLWLTCELLSCAVAQRTSCAEHLVLWFGLQTKKDPGMCLMNWRFSIRCGRTERKWAFKRGGSWEVIGQWGALPLEEIKVVLWDPISSHPSELSWQSAPEPRILSGFLSYGMISPICIPSSHDPTCYVMLTVKEGSPCRPDDTSQFQTFSFQNVS